MEIPLVKFNYFFNHSEQNRVFKDNPESRRIQFISHTSSLICLPLFAYAIYNIIIQNWIFVAVTGISAAMLFIVNLKLMQTGSVSKVYQLIIAVLYVMVLISLVFGKKENYSLVWVTGAPVVTYYLLGSKAGLKINAGFMAFLLVYLLILPREIVSYSSVANVIFCMLFLMVTLFSYEKSRELYQTVLEEKQQQLEKISSTDGLTRLFNRMKIDCIIEEKFSKVSLLRSEPVDWCLIMIDIDHFKKVNDGYGHQQGDKALKAVAASLSSSVPECGQAARWGGEEFLVSLYGVPTEKAVRIAEDIRENIALMEFESGMKITISLGLSAYREGDSYDTLLKRADDCLYEAKGQGRNRVVSDIINNKIIYDFGLEEKR